MHGQAAPLPPLQAGGQGRFQSLASVASFSDKSRLHPRHSAYLTGKGSCPTL